MNSSAIVVELAALADIPEYKVAAMFTHLVRVIKDETRRGGTVSLPRLGVFAGKRRKAKTQKNVIISKGINGVVHGSRNLPARRALGFVPLQSAKWL